MHECKLAQSSCFAVLAGPSDKTTKAEMHKHAQLATSREAGNAAGLGSSIGSPAASSGAEWRQHRGTVLLCKG